MPLIVVSVTELDFGKLMGSASGGTVNLTDGGVRTTSGGVTGVDLDYFAVEIEIMGTPNAKYVFDEPRKVPLAHPTGGASIEIRAVDCNPNKRGTLDTTGRATIRCGGALVVPASPLAGLYASTVFIDFDYK
ncbi:DUF4402 domain-containing protein [Parvularcula mediterranea]|uniref:DUF4402 domain-containing protein n=1 Tax=Parvularcula mediterranea TaxID=2732508 RepID=UPI00156511FA